MRNLFTNVRTDDKEREDADANWHDLLSESYDEFDRWKAKLNQRIQHDAWAAGYSAGSQDGSIIGVGKTNNPHKEES